MPNSVLVVDDEPNILLSLKFLMERAGFVVTTAVDGEQALEAVAVSPPDVILLDVNMPKLNGYGVCEKVRANPRLANTRIIMLTAMGREMEKEKGLALGADEYVTKPFSTREIVDKVTALMNQRAGDASRPVSRG